MTFEFSPSRSFDFVTAFAAWQNVATSGQQVVVPRAFGEGSIRRVDVEEGLTILLHSYTPREEFVLRRRAPAERADRVTLIFYRSALPPGRALNLGNDPTASGTLVDECAVEISSNDLESTFRFPAGRRADFVVVGISTPLLRKYLASELANPAVQTIVGGDESNFLYYVKIWPELDRVLDHLTLLNQREVLGKLHYRIRTEELIFLLFQRLVDRAGGGKQETVSNEQLLKMQALKRDVVRDLSTPPDLPLLARTHTMGQTKLSSLFKQVYGDSIYQFFQSQRMEEAAYLLRHTSLPVGEIGFRLGFSNLSHFGRLFKKHYGQTPKRFATGGG